MASRWAKNFNNGCRLFTLSSYSNAQKILSAKQHSSLINQHQKWLARAYSQLPQNLQRMKIKIESTQVFHKFCQSHLYCSSSSSSSSSSSKFRIIGWYLRKLETRPIVAKAITSSLIYVAADLTSQMMTLPPSTSFDAVRTLRMGAYGMLILGPAQHYWFNFVSGVLPKLDVLTTLKKILMGQAIFGPCINSVFFSYNAALQGESGAEIIARLKRDLPKTLISNALYWPACDFLTYKFVPVQLQPLVNSSFAYVWTIYLTYMASLKKVSAD